MEKKKYQLRREILARRRYGTTKEQQEAAGAVANFVEAAHFKAADVVALYSSIEGEVPTHLIAQKLKNLKVTIAYPYALANGTLRFLKDEGVLAEDDLGILSATGAETVPTVCFVPLVAFDRQGNRLGYGKGYYDKALAKLTGIRTIGLAYSWQEVAALPTAKHDVPLNEIWTEHEVIRCPQKTKP